MRRRRGQQTWQRKPFAADVLRLRRTSARAKRCFRGPRGVYRQTQRPAPKGRDGRLSKNHGVDQGPQPLMFHPALTTQGELPRRGKRRPPGGCASERMKTQRFSYVAGFAARERMREAKPVKARKSGVQPLFRHSEGRPEPALLAC